MGFLLLLQPLKFQSIISNWLARHKAQDIGRHGAGMGQAWGHARGQGSSLTGTLAEILARILGGYTAI
jgi:hypothetical protein